MGTRSDNQEQIAHKMNASTNVRAISMQSRTTMRSNAIQRDVKAIVFPHIGVWGGARGGAYSLEFGIRPAINLNVLFTATSAGAASQAINPAADNMKATTRGTINVFIFTETSAGARSLTTHTHTTTQTHRHTDTQTHRHTDTQTH